MQADALLSQDELDFIQDMQHSPQLNLADPMSSLLVNGDRRLKDLLTRLVANEQVTLQASFNNQQLSFPCNWSRTSSTLCTCNWARRISTRTAPC